MFTFADTTLTHPSDIVPRFEKLHPTPQWALDARRKVLRKRAAQAQRGGNAALVVDSDVSDAETDSEAEGDSADEKDEVDDLFRKATIGGGGNRIKGGRVEPGEIDIDRARDANQHDAKSVRARFEREGTRRDELTDCLSHTPSGSDCRDWFPPSSSSPVLGDFGSQAKTVPDRRYR